MLLHILPNYLNCRTTCVNNNNEKKLGERFAYLTFTMLFLNNVLQQNLILLLQFLFFFLLLSVRLLL